MKKQDIVDYGSVKFHQIIPQDNPAYLDQQCVMIVGSSSCKGKFKVLAIVPDPEESVHEVAEFFRHDHAKIFAEQNELWFTDYIQKFPTNVDDDNVNIGVTRNTERTNQYVQCL
jgi:hypothetical protein